MGRDGNSLRCSIPVRCYNIFIGTIRSPDILVLTSIMYPCGEAVVVVITELLTQQQISSALEDQLGRFFKSECSRIG